MAKKELREMPEFMSTTMLPRQLDWKTCPWFHGTRSSHLEGILQEGILPRAGRQHAGNWEHPSCESMVYLTSAYAMFYASACDDPGLPAVLELDITKLDEARFFADEDSYALSEVEGMRKLNALSVEERVAYWRDRLDETSVETSLRVLGNCTYKGTIPPAAVKAVRLLTQRETARLTLQAHDPVISPGNFTFLGGGHQLFHHWLMGRPTQLDKWLNSLGELSIPLMSLAEAVEYHHKHCAE